MKQQLQAQQPRQLQHQLAAQLPRTAFSMSTIQTTRTSIMPVQILPKSMTSAATTITTMILTRIHATTVPPNRSGLLSGNSAKMTTVIKNKILNLN